MRTLLIIRWNKYTEEWRVLNLKKKHVLEIPIYDCPFVARIEEEVGLSKEKDNLVKVSMELTNGK